MSEIVIGRWNYETRGYDLYIPDKTWHIVLQTFNMKEPINCTNCGRELLYGDAMTSRELHNSAGLGYPVCDNPCYQDELKRSEEHRHD